MERSRSRLDREISRSVTSLPRYQSPSPARSLSRHRLDSIWNHSRSRERLCYIGNSGPVRVINSYHLHHSPSPGRTFQVILCSTKTNQTFTRVTRSLSQYDINSSHMYTSQDSLFDSLASGTSSPSAKEAAAVRRAESCEDVFHQKSSFFSDATPSESGVSFGESEEGSTCGGDEDNFSLHSLDGSSAFFEATGESEHEKGDTDHLSSTDCTGDRIISSVRDSKDRTSSKMGERKRHQKLRPTDSGYSTSSRSDKNKVTSSSSSASSTSATTKDQARYEALRVIIPDHDSSTEDLDQATGRKPSSTPLAHSTPHVSPSGKEEHRFQVFASWNADEKLEERKERKSSSAERAPTGSKMSSTSRSRTRWSRFEDSSYHSSCSDDYSSDLSNNWTPAVATPRKARLKKASDRPIKVSSQAVHGNSGSPPGPDDSVDSATSKRSKNVDRKLAKNNYTEDKAIMRDRQALNLAENADTEYTNGVFYSKESDDWWKDYVNQETEAKKDEEKDAEDESISVSQRSSLVDIPLVAEIPLISAGKYGQAKLRRRSKTSPPSTPARSQSPPTLAETTLTWEEAEDELPHRLSETVLAEKSDARDPAGEVSELSDTMSRDSIHHVGLQSETEEADERIDDLEAESPCHAETKIDERDSDLGNGTTLNTSLPEETSHEWGFPLGILQKNFEKITPIVCREDEDKLVQGQEDTSDNGNTRGSCDYEIVPVRTKAEVVKPNDHNVNSGIFEDCKTVEVGNNRSRVVVNILGNEGADPAVQSKNDLNQTSIDNKVVELRRHEEVVEKEIPAIAEHEIDEKGIIAELEMGSAEWCELLQVNSEGRDVSGEQEAPVLGSWLGNDSGQISEDTFYHHTSREDEDFAKTSGQDLQHSFLTPLQTGGSEVIESREVDFKSFPKSTKSESPCDILVQEDAFWAVGDESGQARLRNQQANVQIASLNEVCVSQITGDKCVQDEGITPHQMFADLKVVPENETPDKCDLDTSTGVVFIRESPESGEISEVQQTLVFASQVEDHNGQILEDVSFGNTIGECLELTKISEQDPEKHMITPLEAGRREVTEYGEVNLQTCVESNRSDNLDGILVQENIDEAVADESHPITYSSDNLIIQTVSLIDTCESQNTEDRTRKNEGSTAQELFAEETVGAENDTGDVGDLKTSQQNIHAGQVTVEFDSVLTERQLKLEDSPVKGSQNKLELGLHLAGETRMEEEVDTYAINVDEGTKEISEMRQKSDWMKSSTTSLKSEFGVIQTDNHVSNNVKDVLQDNVSSVGVKDELVQKESVASSLKETDLGISSSRQQPNIGVTNPGLPDLGISSSRQQPNIGVSPYENHGLSEVKGEIRTDEMLRDSEKLRSIDLLMEPSSSKLESMQKEEIMPTTDSSVWSRDIVDANGTPFNENSFRSSESNSEAFDDQREYSNKEAVPNQSTILIEDTILEKQPSVTDSYPSHHYASEATTTRIAYETCSTSLPKNTELVSVASVITAESHTESLPDLPHITFTEVCNMAAVKEERGQKEASKNQLPEKFLSLAEVSPIADIADKTETKRLVHSPLSESYEPEFIQNEDVALNKTGRIDQQINGNAVTLEFEVKQDPFMLSLVRVKSHANQEQIAEECLTTTDLPSVHVNVINSSDCLRMESNQEPRFLSVATLETFSSPRQTSTYSGATECFVHQTDTVKTGLGAEECRKELSPAAEVSKISHQHLAQNLPDGTQIDAEFSLIPLESINDMGVQAEPGECYGVPVTVSGIHLQSQQRQESITPILLTAETQVCTEKRGSVPETTQPLEERGQTFPSSLVTVESVLNSQLTSPAVGPVVVTRLGNSQQVNASAANLEIQLSAISELSKFSDNVSLESPPLQKQLPDDENRTSAGVLNRVAVSETSVVTQDSMDGSEVTVDKVELGESIKTSTASDIETVQEKEADRTYKARLVFLQPLEDLAPLSDPDAVEGSSCSLPRSEASRGDPHISTVPAASLDFAFNSDEKLGISVAPEEIGSPTGIYNAKMTYISPLDQLEAHLISLAQDEFYSSETTGETLQGYEPASCFDSGSITLNQHNHSSLDYERRTNTEFEKPPVEMNVKWENSEDISKQKSLYFADSYFEMPDKDYDNVTTEMCDTIYDNVTANAFTSSSGRLKNTSLVEPSQRRTSQSKLSKLGTLREETENSSGSASSISTHKTDPVTLLPGVDGGSSFNRRWQGDLKSTSTNVAGYEPITSFASTRRVSETTSAVASADGRDHVQNVHASISTSSARNYKRDLSMGIKTSTFQNDTQNLAFNSTSVTKETASVSGDVFTRLLDDVAKASTVNPDRTRGSFQFESNSDSLTPKSSVSSRVSPSTSSVAEKVSALEQLATALDRCGRPSTDSSISWKPTGLSQKLIEVYNATKKVPKLNDGSGSSVDPEVSRSSLLSSTSSDTKSRPLYTSAGRAEWKKSSYLRFDSPVDTSVAKRKPAVLPTPIKRAEKQKESDNFDKILDEFDQKALDTISEFIFVRKIPTVSKDTTTPASSSSSATLSDDLYKSFTRENSEKTQNHICIVIEDDNMSTFRFKRYLKKAHVKRKKGEKVLSFLSRLAGVPEAAGTPLSALYHRLKQNDQGTTRTFSTDSMPRISNPVLVSSTSAFTQNLVQATPVQLPAYAGNASFTSINSKGSFRDSIDSAYSSLSGSISGIPETPGLQRCSNSTFFASPVRFGSASSVFHSGSTSGGDWSYSDTDLPNGCDVTPRTLGTSGVQDRVSPHKLEEGNSARTTASLSDVFEQLNDCQDEIDTALLNKYQYGHFQTQVDQHRS